MVECSGRGLAQLVARRVWDAEAAGSSPVTPTMVYVTTLSGRFYSVQDWLKPHVKFTLFFRPFLPSFNDKTRVYHCNLHG